MSSDDKQPPAALLNLFMGESTETDGPGGRRARAIKVEPRLRLVKVFTRDLREPKSGRGLHAVEQHCAPA